MTLKMTSPKAFRCLLLLAVFVYRSGADPADSDQLESEPGELSAEGPSVASVPIIPTTRQARCGNHMHSTHTNCPPEQSCDAAIAGTPPSKICSFLYSLTPFCACDTGYYRDVNNRCVSQQTCKLEAQKLCMLMKCSQGFICKYGKCQPEPVKCGRNQVPVSCGPCPPEQTCQAALNGIPPPTICSDLCRVIPACFCTKNFYRLGNKCVSKRTCFRKAQKPVCGPNESVPDCVSCDPEKTCDDPNPEPRVCTYICVKNSRAYCDEGFFRNKSGDCVPFADCRPTYD